MGKLMVGRIIILISFIVLWGGLTGFDNGLTHIFLVPLTIFFITWQLKLLPKNNIFKIGAIFYIFWLVKEIFMSAIAVVKIACRQNLRIQPLLEPIKSIQKTDTGIVIYANSITLTPGTVTLSTEDNVLLVHALDSKFMDDLQGGEMDNRINKIIRYDAS
jgi:multicomponent Na+:H+ antiporter subunit E